MDHLFKRKQSLQNLKSNDIKSTASGFDTKNIKKQIDTMFGYALALLKNFYFV